MLINDGSFVSQEGSIGPGAGFWVPYGELCTVEGAAADGGQKWGIGF